MTNVTAEQLPGNPEALKALLRQQSEQLEHKQQRIRLLEEQILLLRNKQFSSSSEKADSAQLEFFNEAETAA
ncbi:transposase, partial [Microbulbifer sp. 2205BS26-8]|uniref:transposase n=1 Tax=Microbulbifer sp. 2205BS26-8 TaxID=3064386 RepID=UPI00273D8DE8